MNYTLAQPAGLTASITPRPLTVTAQDATVVSGSPLPVFTASYNGFALTDTVASLGGTLRFSTPASPSAAPGSYSVSPYGLTAQNYSITYVDGVLDITPAAPGTSTSTANGTQNLPVLSHETRR